MRKILCLLLIFSTLDLQAKSCGSYVKAGKKHYIPCSKGNILGTTSSAASCNAKIAIGGRVINLSHRCVVKPTGQTGALALKEPAGEMKNRQQKLKVIINLLADKYKIDRALAHAIITVESAYRNDVMSDKGAIGLMQLMPTTAGALNIENPFDPTQNIDGGLRYLAMMLKEFNNNETLAVAAYNAGPGAVYKFKKSVPKYTQTQNYVKKVSAWKEKYSKEWKQYIE